MEFYDGTKLLSLKDLSGNTPEIYICTSNRSAGKTTYFNRLVINRYKKSGKKFGLLYRYNYELSDCADKFFKDIQGLFFPDDVMSSKSKAKGMFHELYLNGDSCGYALSINNADGLKKYSHLLSDIDSMIFDEFQSENGNYCPNEIRKFISIHTSIARGKHKQVRYVPVYMISNPVTILNPYYTHLGITERLNKNVKFLKGNGFVLEQGFNESASELQLASSFNKAFSGNDYIAYSAQNVYLDDNYSFIERPSGFSKYLATIKYNGKEFALRAFPDTGYIYCDDNPDTSFKTKLSITTNDHEENYLMIKSYDLFVTNMKYYFDKGCFRFKNLICKEAVLKMLSY